MISGYPISYEKTLLLAKKEAAFGKAVDDAEEIERRYTRIATGQDYTIADIRKETLMDDIAILLCAVNVFLNKVEELKALSEHRNPKNAKKREVVKIHFGRMGK
jgi:hypothetical protein